MIDDLLEKVLNYGNHQAQHLAYIHLEDIISKWMVEEDIIPYLSTIFDTLSKALLQQSKNTPKHYIHIYQLLSSLIDHLSNLQLNQLNYYIDDILPLLLKQWYQFVNQYQQQKQKQQRQIQLQLKKSIIFFISSASSLSPLLLPSPPNHHHHHNDTNNHAEKERESFLALMNCLCKVIQVAPMKLEPYIETLFDFILKLTEYQVEQLHNDRYSSSIMINKNSHHHHHQNLQLNNNKNKKKNMNHHQQLLSFRSFSSAIQLINQSLYFMNAIIQSYSKKAQSLIQSSKHELIGLFSILITSNWSIDLKYIIYHLLAKCYIISTDFMKRTVDLFLSTILSNFDIIVYHHQYHHHQHHLYTKGLKKLIYIFSIMIDKKVKHLHQYGSDIINKLLSLLLDNHLQFQIRLVICSILDQVIQHHDSTIVQPYIQDIVDIYLSLLKLIPQKIIDTKEAYFTYKQLIQSLFMVIYYFPIIDILPLLYEIIDDFPSEDRFSLSCSFYENLCLFKKKIGQQRWQELLANMPPSTLMDLENIHSLAPFCIPI